MKRIVGFLLLIALFFGNSLAHSGKPKYHVIIDTDGAIDDMRAICMLLSANDIRVLAITCSQGTLNPEEVCVKVSSLLKAFHHEGIPVGVSEQIPMEPPVWASTALGYKWADESNMQTSEHGSNSMELLNRTLEDYPEKVTLIALGSLKTYADWYIGYEIREGIIAVYLTKPMDYQLYSLFTNLGGVLINLVTISIPTLIILLFIFKVQFTVGIGLFLSTVSNTQQQLMFIAFFFMITFILMSGVFTPVDSMPSWAQKVNLINPVAYFMRVIRMILLKGSEFGDIAREFYSLCLYAMLILTLAITNYRKTT